MGKFKMQELEQFLEFIEPAELGFRLDEIFTEYSYYLATHSDQATMVLEGKEHLYFINQLRCIFFRMGGVFPPEPIS
jgi:hypothetical protein